ncbi:hypothetical protein EVAR_24211_1 [Eumeta japonica]|uniref:Uncharacterized protein n=1 Tax=Eumeta variegata TaxID=151549 RepID=A0A4C1W3W6_EUMVA|nr:hypothetical protein EVAR_24211_1 [Eumeta japonica]
MMYVRGLNLRVVANDAQAGPGRSTQSTAQGARVWQHTRTQDGLRSLPWASGATSTAYLPEIVRTRGRRGYLVSWRPIPLRHAEACAAARCRESTLPKRLGFQNLSSIESHTIGTVMLFSDIDPGPYRKRQHYLAPVNDYHQRPAALPS